MSMMPQFLLPMRIPESDIDRLGHVNNVAFLRYVQDVAVAHWSAIAPHELQQQYIWVVRRHELEYLRPGLPDDELVLQTWVGEPSGATWERFTHIVRAGDQEILVKARTVWVLIDATTGRPRRVDPQLVAHFSQKQQN